MASLAEVKRYFGYTESKVFMADWKKLDSSEKEFFRTGVKKATS